MLTTTDQWRSIRKVSVSLFIFFTVIVIAGVILSSMNSFGNSSLLVVFTVPMCLFCVASFAAYLEGHPRSRMCVFSIVTVVVISLAIICGTALEEMNLFSGNTVLVKYSLILLQPFLFAAFTAAVSAPRLHVKYEGIRVITFITGLLIFIIILLNVCTAADSSPDMVSASILIIVFLLMALFLQVTALIICYNKCKSDFN